MVKQEVHVEDEELLVDLAVVLRFMDEEIEDKHAMPIQNYSGLEMQEYTQHLHGSLRQHQDLLDDL